ncbi:ABC transporter permease subunit [Acetobacter sp.]|jgi:NitT/TauT family transport system permease protein|uniref:ABC transporter permease subunit n=1 Tax=Acetobacter sp. TaxID=440 RepID=UPI0025C512C7|nr:ABC transporter permease subunit [Acetobacter sp.]MCH4090679.1 ABC transporter permease subunit [Acetobacter sp.]MCI1300122.1 ABC transporter permease subunit [Acetobacter sp.]MCI1316540.1 ABC transporter permease subunit [Acetobacter sp.]
MSGTSFLFDAAGLTKRVSHASPRLTMIVAMLCVAGVMLGFGSNATSWFGVVVSDPQSPAQVLPLTALPLALFVTTARVAFWFTLSVLCALAGSALVFGREKPGRVALALLEIVQAVPIPAFMVLALPVCFGAHGWLAGHPLAGEILIGAPAFAALTFPMTDAAIRAHQEVPSHLVLAARSLRLRAWPRFWRLYAPFGLPAAVQSIGHAMSNVWLGLIFAEVYAGMKGLPLPPGLGGHAVSAIRNNAALPFTLTLLAMGGLVVMTDMFCVRPMRKWGQRFEKGVSGRSTSPFMGDIPLIGRILTDGTRLLRIVGNLPLGPAPRATVLDDPEQTPRIIALIIPALLGVAGLLTCAASPKGLPDPDEWLRAGLLGIGEMLNLFVPLGLCSIVLLPIAVGLKRWADPILPIFRFLTLFPAVLLFPLVVALVGPESVLSPLLFVGLPFFLAFYLLVGVRDFPRNLQEVARAYRIRGWLKWKTILLPGLAQSWLRGVHRAFFWGWNAIIAADMTLWGTHVSEHGLIGRSIINASSKGDMAQASLGIMVMTLLAMGSEALIWRPLDLYVRRRTAGHVKEIP